MAEEKRQEGRREKGRQNGKGKEEASRPTGTPHPIVFAMAVGLFAGLFIGFVRWFCVALRFTNVQQAFLADAFVKRSTLGHAGWQWTGLALFIVMSVVAAVVYWLVLGRLSGPWPGLAFGAVWWALVFVAAGPPTGMTESLKAIGWRSLTTEFCLYLVWGLFIGYSIAFEFHDEAAHEPFGQGKGGGGQGDSGRTPHPAS